MSKPSDTHPFRAQAWPRARRTRKTRRNRHHGQWQCTHLLVYEDQIIGRLYFWRAAYYTLEQYECGEPGITRRDLREGETLESAFETREE